MPGNFWRNDVTVLIAFIISCLSILSYFLAINEYYTKKAYWDYYHVHDKCRSTMRSGFHAEYLSYAVVLLTVFIIIFEVIQRFWNNIKSNWLVVYIVMSAVLSLALYIFFRLIIWKFHLTDVNERLVWKSIKEYKKFIKVKSKLYYKEYSICCVAVLLGMFLSIKENSLFIFGVFIILVFIFMQFENYSKRQILLSYRKWVDITVYDEHTYAIIEEHLDYFYLIKCKIDQDTLKLYLDDYLITKKDCMDAETKYFTNIEKYCHSRLCNNHYIIGYRDDLGDESETQDGKNDGGSDTEDKIFTEKKHKERPHREGPEQGYVLLKEEIGKTKDCRFFIQIMIACILLICVILFFAGRTANGSKENVANRHRKL